jgi:acetyltransferase-like isoleucine patch superfamily enzyme
MWPTALPEGALPGRWRDQRFWTRLGDMRLRRRLLRASALDVAPPAPHQWAAFGRSIVVPPARIWNPECIAIGDGVLILEHLFINVVRAFPDIEPRVVIEDDVHIGRGCGFGIAGELVIERGALIGDFVYIGDTFHPHEEEDRLASVARPAAVRIGAGAILGNHVAVQPGVTIGAGAMVEHHSVVARDVAPGAVVAGYPARPRRAKNA